MGMTASQRTKYTKRRAQIWEALHPVVKTDTVSDLATDSNTTSVSLLGSSQNNSGAACATIPERGRGRPEGFAAATAAATGQSKATTNRALARADALGDTTLDKITGTSLDTGVEMDALANQKPASLQPVPPKAISVMRGVRLGCAKSRWLGCYSRE